MGVQLATSGVSVWIKDALHGRDMARIDLWGAVRLYRVYFSAVYLAWYRFALFLILFIGFFESPTSTRRIPPGWEPGTKSDRWQPHVEYRMDESTRAHVLRPLLLIIELACATAFVTDMVIAARLQGPRKWVRGLWSWIKMLSVGVSVSSTLVSFFIAIAAPTLQTPVLHVAARLVRPIIVIEHFRNVRRACNSIVSSVPKITRVLLLLIILVTFFSLVFHVLFRGIEGRYPYGGPNGTFADSAVHPSESSPARAQSVCHWGQPPSAEVARHQEEGNLAKCSVFVKGGAAGCKDYFRTLQDSWIELFILVTTANYPDVMLPVIDCSIWMALPFIIYVVAGLYFFMSLILAVAYVHFASESDARTSQFIFKRRKALVGAFHAIVHIQEQHAAQRAAGHGLTGSEPGVAEAEEALLIASACVGRDAAREMRAGGSKRVTFSSLLPIAKAMNPTLTDDCVALIFSTLRGVDPNAERFASESMAAGDSGSNRSRSASIFSKSALRGIVLEAAASEQQPTTQPAMEPTTELTMEPTMELAKEPTELAVSEGRLTDFLGGASAGLSLAEFMRICTYITLRFKRRRGRWGQLIITKSLCNCSGVRRPKCCYDRDPNLMWAAREAVRRSETSDSDPPTMWWRVVKGSQELLFRIVHTEINFPLLAAKGPVEENDPSRLTSQTLSGSTHSRRASGSHNVVDNDAAPQLCAKGCLGEERYRGTDGDTAQDSAPEEAAGE